MACEKNLVLYAEDPALIATYLNIFGVEMKQEGSKDHWCAERGDNTLHVCLESRHDPARVPDEPGVHGVWQFITHRLSSRFRSAKHQD